MEREGEKSVWPGPIVPKRRWPRLGAERIAQGFALELPFGPLGMVLAKPRPGELTDRQAHLHRKLEPLLAGHAAMNLVLNGLCTWAGVAHSPRWMNVT